MPGMECKLRLVAISGAWGNPSEANGQQLVSKLFARK